MNIEIQFASLGRVKLQNKAHAWPCQSEIRSIAGSRFGTGSDPGPRHTKRNTKMVEQEIAKLGPKPRRLVPPRTLAPRTSPELATVADISSKHEVVHAI